jgi:proton-coupled amino acid transporter
LQFPAYQVFSQPVFAAVERTIRHRKGSVLASTRKWAFRLTFRSLYVVIVAFVAIALPFFSDFVGLIGALGFWPATVLFPIEMYRKIHRPGLGMTIWLETVNVFCFLITVCAIMGSVQLIIMDASSYATPF